MMAVELTDSDRSNSRIFTNYIFSCARFRVKNDVVRFRVKRLDKVMTRVFDLTPEVEFKVIFEKGMRVRITTAAGVQVLDRIVEIHWNFPQVHRLASFVSFKHHLDWRLRVPVIDDGFETRGIPDIISLRATRYRKRTKPRSQRGYSRSSG